MFAAFHLLFTYFSPTFHLLFTYFSPTFYCFAISREIICIGLGWHCETLFTYFHLLFTKEVLLTLFLVKIQCFSP